MSAIEKALNGGPRKAPSSHSAMKFEARNSKPETISKSENRNPEARARFEIRDSNLFRISDFEFRISIFLTEPSREIAE